MFALKGFRSRAGIYRGESTRRMTELYELYHVLLFYHRGQLSEGDGMSLMARLLARLADLESVVFITSNLIMKCHLFQRRRSSDDVLMKAVDLLMKLVQRFASFRDLGGFCFDLKLGGQHDH